MKKSILRLLSDKGILVDPDAADALAQLDDPMKCANLILEDGVNRPLVLTKADVENYAACISERPMASKASAISRSPSEGSKKLSEEVVVLKDITGNSTCIGNVIDFAKLFNDRYDTIRRILAKRRELSGLLPISRLKKAQRDLRFVGIINEIRTTKNGHTLLEMEDEEDKIQVLIMKGSKKGSESFVKDEVVGVVGSLSKDGEIVVAKEFVRPDVPLNSGLTPNASESVLAFVSDIHVGSTEFLNDEWNRFVAWLNKTSSTG
jgi:DNA polymerase II small subunit